MIVLDECFRNSEFSKTPLVVGFDERSPVVMENVGDQFPDAGDVCWDLFHESGTASIANLLRRLAQFTGGVCRFFEDSFHLRTAKLNTQRFQPSNVCPQRRVD